jgi:cytidylate kinase
VKPRIVAIDGPAGAGKSTVSKLLARRLGYRYLDSGAMYRCVALAVSSLNEQGAPPERLGEIASRLQIKFVEGDPQRVVLNGADVSDSIRTPAIGELASAVSVHPPVRRALVAKQKSLIEAGGWVLEGRDATTVIAPEAELKVYLTADLRTRAERRFAEFRSKDPKITLEEVEKQIEERDRRDSTRADSPLRIADDAVVVDTSAMTIDQVVAKLEDLAARAF